VNKTKEEHRRFQRFDSFVDVHFKLHGELKKEVEGLTGDLSRDGLKLFTDEKLDNGNLLDLVIQIPDDPKPVRAHGEVVWRHPSHEKQSRYTVGIRFLGFDPVDKFRILDYAYNNWLEDKIEELGTYDPELKSDTKKK
jgi:c-di-GMP-binding flagellar brake protein YcgR